MEQYRVSGSAAYAAVPAKRPSHLPDEPKKVPTPVHGTKRGIAPYTVFGTAAILVLLFCVLFSMVRLFEARSEARELERQKLALETRQEQLRLEYEQSIDLDAVAKRAEELGMHLPWGEQMEYLPVELPEPVAERVEGVKTGVFAAFLALAEDMQAYFS